MEYNQGVVVVEEAHDAFEVEVVELVGEAEEVDGVELAVVIGVVDVVVAAHNADRDEGSVHVP